MKIYQKEKKGNKRQIYLFGHKVFSYKKEKVSSVSNEEYEVVYSKRFSGLSLQEKKIILEAQFKKYAGYPLNLNFPQTFNEKIQWLKLFWQDPLMTQCADKVAVRDYVAETVGGEYLVPILGVYDNPEDINFDLLPDKFVIKINWGSGENIIVQDKSKLDIEKTKQRLLDWMDFKNNHYYDYLEWAYKDITPKILIEKYIEQKDGKLLDWKFFCFDGKAKFVQVDVDRNTNHRRCFYDMEYKKQEFTTMYPFFEGEVQKPDNFDIMKNIAEKLAGMFPFVRVDMYCLGSQIKFGEMTFYHGNGTERFKPAHFDKILGDMLKLPLVPYKAPESKLNRVAVYQDDVYTYPDKKNLFRPSVKYPEYQLGDLSPEENKVYDMVRETFKLMEMDIDHYGTSLWNPLTGIVKPGDCVLIKPNLVLDKNGSGEGEECLYTQPAVVAAMIDYVLIALQNKGKIIVGDAPLQECVFDKLIENSGYKDLIEYYKNKGVDITLVDFRNVKTYVGKDGLHYTQNDAATDNDKGVVVTLNDISSFSGLDAEHLKKMRITNYDPRILQKHHSVNKHEYKVSQYILDADVIINMPKPKTHRKAGVTAALKNLVGINANKEYLPHHTLGSKEEGGDAYLHKNLSLTKANKFLDLINIFNSDGNFKKARAALKHYNSLRKKGVKESGEKYWEGSWYGNDTIGRTLFDLNKILFYADKKGNIKYQKQRKYFIVGDMIVSGDREGPLEPSRKPVGIIMMGYDPACFDRVVASIMGFDYHLIPSISDVISRKGGVCEITSGKQPKVLTNVKEWQNEDLVEIANNLSLCFRPTDGWRKVLW